MQLIPSRVSAVYNHDKDHLPLCVSLMFLLLLLLAGHTVTSGARRTVLLTPQTANTSPEEEAARCSGILWVFFA